MKPLWIAAMLAAFGFGLWAGYLHGERSAGLLERYTAVLVDRAAYRSCDQLFVTARSEPVIFYQMGGCELVARAAREALGTTEESEK